MVDTPIPPHLVQDPLEHNVPGFGLGRDPARTPMPWSSEPHGGFTGGRPWLPLNADAEVLNVRTAPFPHLLGQSTRATLQGWLGSADTPEKSPNWEDSGYGELRSAPQFLLGYTASRRSRRRDGARSRGRASRSDSRGRRRRVHQWRAAWRQAGKKAGP